MTSANLGFTARFLKRCIYSFVCIDYVNRVPYQNIKSTTELPMQRVSNAPIRAPHHRRSQRITDINVKFELVIYTTKSSEQVGTLCKYLL